MSILRRNSVSIGEKGVDVGITANLRIARGKIASSPAIVFDKFKRQFSARKIPVEIDDVGNPKNYDQLVNDLGDRTFRAQMKDGVPAAITDADLSNSIRKSIMKEYPTLNPKAINNLVNDVTAKTSKGMTELTTKLKNRGDALKVAADDKNIFRKNWKTTAGAVAAGGVGIYAAAEGISFKKAAGDAAGELRNAAKPIIEVGTAIAVPIISEVATTAIKTTSSVTGSLFSGFGINMGDYGSVGVIIVVIIIVMFVFGSTSANENQVNRMGI